MLHVLWLVKTSQQFCHHILKYLTFIVENQPITNIN